MNTIDSVVIMERMNELRILTPLSTDHFNSSIQCFTSSVFPQTLQGAIVPLFIWVLLVIIGSMASSKLLSLLSIRRSVNELFSGRSTHLDTLDVYRSFAIFWVMINHTGSEGRIDILDRLPSAQQFKTAIHDDPIMGALLGNSALGVEIFLVLSALLAGRSWLLKADLPFWDHYRSFILRRLVRLIPSMFVFVFIAAGPIMPHLLPRFSSTMTSDCGIWGILSHLTFTSNWQSTPTCMGYLWYLGLDMQLYIVAPFLLHILHKSFKSGLVLSIALIILSSISRALICISNNTCNKSDVDIPFISFPGQDAQSMASVYAGLWEIYSRPYSKCGPFIVGLILGYLTQRSEAKMSLFMSRVVFNSSLLLAIATIYGILPEYWYPDSGTTVYNTLYTSLFRTVFSIAVSGMIGAHYFRDFHRKVPKTFSILAKLTYNAYLVHMPVVYIFNFFPFLQSATSAYHLISVIPLVFIVSFLFAFLFYIFVEAPIGNFTSKMFFSKVAEEKKSD